MSKPVEYDYDELIHDYEGPQVPCRECGAHVYVKHVSAFGCYQCDAEARTITIKAKDE